MPHKNNTRPRGRPRAFDEAQVLNAARDAFWQRGLSGVSLDALAEETGVARPSLAAAFGDKRALYLRVVEAFTAEMFAAAKAVMTARKPLRDELAAFFEGALALYLSGDVPKGCLGVCTLPVAAAEDDDVRAALLTIIAATDDIFRRRFTEEARKRRFDVEGRSFLAASLLHSIAIRARAGQPKRELKAMVASAVELLAA
jgi:TetR/AcrR family transcriptional regulator, copper-responsive repressor